MAGVAGLRILLRMNNADVVKIVYEELLKVAGGVSVLVAALSAFLGKIWIERIANRERQRSDEKLARLQSQLDKQGDELRAKLDVGVQRTVLVDKVQFEHEYEIYRQAWERMVALRSAVLRVRPMLDQVDPKESKEERVARRIGECREPYNAFLEIIEKSKPFFPAQVYSSLDAVREQCRLELIDCEYVDRSHSEYWKEARKNRDELLRLIDGACEAIRTRIADVRVV